MKDGSPSTSLTYLSGAIANGVLAAGDIIQIEEMLKLAISKHAEILENNVDDKSRESVSLEFTTSLIELIDKALDSSPAFFGLPLINRREIIDTIQNKVDATLRLLADNLMGENYRNVAKNLSNSEHYIKSINKITNIGFFYISRPGGKQLKNKLRYRNEKR